MIFGTRARVATGSFRKKVIDDSPDLLDGLANGNVLIDPSFRCHVGKPLTSSEIIADVIVFPAQWKF